MPKNQTGRKVKNEASARKRRAAKSKGESDRSGYQQKVREKKLAEGSRSRKGCFPKLLTLVLPFMAVGAYLLFRS
jgi:hypothetical protein